MPRPSSARRRGGGGGGGGEWDSGAGSDEGEGAALVGKKARTPRAGRVEASVRRWLRRLLLALHPSRGLFQWTGCLVISFITFSAALAYDSIGALGPQLKHQLKENAGGLADLYASYHLPNLVLVFFGGLLSDRIGIRRASLIASSLVVTGVTIVAASSTLLSMMVGRFVFGAGSETLSVIQLSMLQRWFSHRRGMPTLGVACAVSLTVARLGTASAFDLLPWIGETDLWHALWFVQVVAVACLGLNLVFVYMDHVIGPHLPVVEAAEPAKDGGAAGGLDADDDDLDAAGRANAGAEGDGAEGGALAGVVRSVRALQPSFWYIVVIAICHYSVMISFSDFSSDFFNEEWGYSPQEASRIQSVVTMIGLMFIPVGGYIADRFGHRVHMMLFGSCMLVPAHLLVSVVKVYPLYSVVLQGFGSVLVASTIWPSLALVLPPHMMNTAVGLMTAMQNTSLFVVPQLVGEMRVRTGSYTTAMAFFLLPDLLCIAAVTRLLGQKDPVHGVDILRLSAAEIHGLADDTEGGRDGGFGEDAGAGAGGDDDDDSDDFDL